MPVSDRPRCCRPADLLGVVCWVTYATAALPEHAEICNIYTQLEN